MTRFFFLLILLSALLACTRETETIETDLGREYFPLQVGRVWEYQVDSIIFDPVGNSVAVDSTRSWLREEIIALYVDAAGDTVFQTERYVRSDTTHNWQISKVLALSQNTRQATRTEDNLRFVKMVFPLKTGARWNGNQYIDDALRITVAGEVIHIFKDWQSEVLDQSGAWSNGIRSFDDVAMIAHADSENLIEYRFVQEAYARNIGLIYNEMRILDTQCQACCNADFARCSSLPWNQKAEKGFIIKQRLIHWQ